MARKRRRKRKPLPATDPVVRGCLSQIRRGVTDAVGVLADYLEENSLPGRKQLRSLWGKYNEYVDSWKTVTDWSRRSCVLWEVIARNRRWLRQRIGELYGREWARLPLEAFK